MAALTGSGVEISYGPVLFEVFLGSMVVGLVAATLVYFWLDPTSPAAQVPAPIPAGPEAEAPSEPSTGPEIGSQDRSLPAAGDDLSTQNPASEDAD
jgi:hypothetical protein